MSSLYALITLDAGGGTIDLNDYAPNTRFLITSATITLTSNWTIQHTAPQNGVEYELIMALDADLNGNNITVLGTAITQKQAQSRGTIWALYNGASYNRRTSVDYQESGWVNTAQLADDAVTTAKILDANITENKILNGAVTAAKLDASAQYEIVTVPVSFETDEQGAGYVVYFPYACTLILARTYVTKDLAITDDGTIAVSSSLGVVTGSPITIPASSAIGFNLSTNFSGPNAVVAADSVVTFTTAKATVGGKALLTVVVQRT